MLLPNRYFYSLLFFVLLSWSCANIIPLEGGLRDTAPPRVLKVVPDSFKTGFSEKKITLYFDEFVTVQNAPKELFVSPPMLQKPEIVSRGKSVDILLPDTLLPNTTYILHLGKSIADNNEGNVLEGYSYVFSTGEVLDSLSLLFETLDAFTLKPVAEVKILLYDKTGDSLPFKQQPSFMGITNNGGFVTLNYLKPGDFMVFALQSANDNLLYDKEDERIGFLEQRIASGDSVKHRLLMFREIARTNKLRFARMLYPGKIVFKFAQPADAVLIEPITVSLPAFAQSSEFASPQHDSLIYWYQPLATDTLRFRLFINGAWDTITVKPVKATAGRESRGKGVTQPQAASDEKRLEPKPLVGTSHDFFLPVRIALNHPLKQTDTSRIEVWEDKRPVRFSLRFSDTVPRFLEVHANWKEGKKYTVKLLHGAITDILGIENDSIEFTFTATRSTDYIALRLNMQQVLNTSSVILQWLKEDDTVFREESVAIDSEARGTTTISQLSEGKYRIRMIYDANNNGRWDTGNYLEKKQPEKVSYFPQTIEVRKGFDMNLDWDVTQEPAATEGRKVKP